MPEAMITNLNYGNMIPKLKIGDKIYSYTGRPYTLTSKIHCTGPSILVVQDDTSGHKMYLDFILWRFYCVVVKDGQVVTKEELHAHQNACNA